MVDVMWNQARKSPTRYTFCVDRRLNILGSTNIFQATCTKVVWKNSYANLLCIQDITKTLKVQEVISNSFTKIINQVKEEISNILPTILSYFLNSGNTHGLFEGQTAKTIQTQNYKLLSQALSNMDKFRYAILNTSVSKQSKSSLTIYFV